VNGTEFENLTLLEQSLLKFTAADEFLKLHYFKENLMDIIRSMTIYHDYLSEDFLGELIRIEIILMNNIFQGGSLNLSASTGAFQQLFFHNEFLFKYRVKEFTKYEKAFKLLDVLYWEKNYAEFKKDA
jgi:hypothetical protein